MRLFHTILLLLLTVFISRAQEADSTNTRSIVPVLMSSTDSMSVIGAHIINQTSQLANISRLDGSFKMYVSPGDTLQITAIGYEDIIIEIDSFSSYDTLYFTEAVYELDQATINPYPNKDQLKDYFLDLEIDEDPVELNLEEYKGSGPIGPNASPELGLGVSIAGPVSAIYNAFSKKAKRERAHVEWLNNQKKNEKVYAKYNPELVMQITGVEDQEEAVKVMEYCQLSDRFINESLQYDIAVEILSCFKRYQEQ